MMDLKNEERVAEYGESAFSSTKVGLNMPYDKLIQTNLF